MYNFKVFEASLEEQLHDFSQFLWQQGIPNRVNEESGKQVMWVSDQRHVDPVRRAYDLLSKGELKIERVPVKDVIRNPQIRIRWRRIWLTISLVILSIFGGILPYIDTSGTLLTLLTFQDFAFNGRSLVFTPAKESFAAGEYWRLLTPIFVHFGALHLIFNALWTWDLGRRIEERQGRLRLLAIVLLVGIGGNIFQYVMSPNTLFGGMSGVIYGLLGYIWMWDRISPYNHFRLPPGIIGFMLVWLFLGMSGLFSVFGVHVANAVHAAGLIIGMLMGAWAGWLQRSASQK